MKSVALFAQYEWLHFYLHLKQYNFYNDKPPISPQSLFSLSLFQHDLRLFMFNLFIEKYFKYIGEYSKNTPNKTNCFRASKY